MAKPTISAPSVAPVRFFKEVRSELGKVQWPTRHETLKLTSVVIVVSLIVALFVGGLDLFFLNTTAMVFK